jgi:hypothetical protein
MLLSYHCFEPLVVENNARIEHHIRTENLICEHKFACEHAMCMCVLARLCLVCLYVHMLQAMVDCDSFLSPSQTITLSLPSQPNRINNTPVNWGI